MARSPRVLAFVLGLALAAASPAGLSAATPASPRGEPYSALRPWLSSAGEILFREELAAGRLLNHPLVRWYSTPTWSTDRDTAHEIHFAHPLAIQALGPDGRANDRIPLTCPGCQNLPLIQTEAAIAVLGSNLVASWNEGESSCQTNTRQSYGWSADGGLTFTDANGAPFSPTNGASLFGDATAAANAKTGRFYVAGLHGGGTAGSGVGLMRGAFGGGAFTIDFNEQLEAGAEDFLDKPWMTVDSLSGNVYMSWTRFAESDVRIEFQAFDADLDSLGPVQIMGGIPPCGAQFSQVNVGPNGEVWVSWLVNRCATDQMAVVQVRKSTDFGATFGPTVDAAVHASNHLNGGPGFLRTFAATQPYLAVDRSNGPHRGRLYLTFDACVNYTDDPIPLTTTRFETEPNNTYLTANLLIPGGKLRGEKTGVEDDWFRIDMLAGQTFWMETTYSPAFDYDSTRSGIGARIWCPGSGGLVRLVRAAGTSGGLLFTAKHDGPYYLQLEGSFTAVSPYVFRTAMIPTQSSDIAQDHRDQLVTWSDDGVNWSTPVRLNDTPPGVDGQYPTIAVDGRGRVHVFWMDFREDPGCGAISGQFMRSSGDGGATWGPNRRITDDVSSWTGPYCNQLNGNTQGDYQMIATDGDIVAAAFNDARLGDPDIFVDASIHRALSACATIASATAGVDTAIDLSLTNAGNYARTMDWRVEDTQGWITGGSPGLSGSETLATGAELVVNVMVRAPDCDPDSTRVLWITSDPAIPGYEDTCVTVIRCRDIITPVLVSLASVEAATDRVRLVWSVGSGEYAPIQAWRRSPGSDWLSLGAVTLTSDGARYEDLSVRPGERYAYRLELQGPEGALFSGETWVDVPGVVVLGIDGLTPNPATGDLEVSFALPGGGGARLELYDIAGRRIVMREVGHLGPGHHRERIAAQGDLPSGVYTVRLVQGPQHASIRAVVMR